MRGTLLVATVLIACLGVARGREPEGKVSQLKREIADLRAKLADKEAELAKVLPPAAVGPLNLGTAKLGYAGRFALGEKDAGGVYVEQVIDGQSLLAKIIYINNVQARFILAVPTRGMVDGRVDRELSDGAWRVADTRMHGGRTYFVLERWPEPKK